jgi:hypothetical protein
MMIHMCRKWKELIVALELQANNESTDTKKHALNDFSQTSDVEEDVAPNGGSVWFGRGEET